MKNIINNISRLHKAISDKLWSNKLVMAIIFVIAVIVPFGVTVLTILNGDKIVKVFKKHKEAEA